MCSGMVKHLIISQKLKDEKRQQIRDVFKRFDINQDNHLHVYEFQEALEAMGFDTSEESIKCLLLDIKKTDKRISSSEFEEVAMDLVFNRDPVEEMLTVFKIIDYDGDGVISLEDLHHITEELDYPIPAQELQSLIDEFDKNKDGKINEEEFLAIMIEGDT